MKHAALVLAVLVVMASCVSSPPGAGAAAKGARMQAECPQGVPLPGSQCGVGNGRTIAWTAHDDEFSSGDRSLAVAEQPAERRRARCRAQW